MKTPLKNIILLLLIIILCVNEVTAQTLPKPATQPPPPQPLPIDSGLSLLFLSGVAYGLFELRKKRK